MKVYFKDQMGTGQWPRFGIQLNVIPRMGDYFIWEDRRYEVVDVTFIRWPMAQIGPLPYEGEFAMETVVEIMLRYVRTERRTNPEKDYVDSCLS